MGARCPIGITEVVDGTMPGASDRRTRTRTRDNRAIGNVWMSPLDAYAMASDSLSHTTHCHQYFRYSGVSPYDESVARPNYRRPARDIRSSPSTAAFIDLPCFTSHPSARSIFFESGCVFPEYILVCYRESRTRRSSSSLKSDQVSQVSQIPSCKPTRHDHHRIPTFLRYPQYRSFNSASPVCPLTTSTSPYYTLIVGLLYQYTPIIRCCGQTTRLTRPSTDPHPWSTSIRLS